MWQLKKASPRSLQGILLDERLCGVGDDKFPTFVAWQSPVLPGVRRVLLFRTCAMKTRV